MTDMMHNSGLPLDAGDRRDKEYNQSAKEDAE